jgi:hypothetical protein
MLSLDQIQAKIVTLLSGASYLTGLTIIPDLGTSQNEKDIADALNSKGVALSVWPPGATKTMGQGKAGIFEFEAEISVYFEMNPERNATATNPGGANKEMQTLLKAGIKAVLAYRGEAPAFNPQDLFTLADQNPITLDAFDPGLFRYHVVFNKRCVL